MRPRERAGIPALSFFGYSKTVKRNPAGSGVSNVIFCFDAFFFTRTGTHPTDQSEGMLRSKTIEVMPGLIADGSVHSAS